MTPKNIELGPGVVYSRQPEGLQQLYPLDEAPDTEAEDWAEEWPKENPYIKAIPKEATFTAEMKISPDVAKAFTALGEACKQAAEALGRAVRAAADMVQAMLNEVPPRVRHLAQHGKKYRTRKKNINRALREYERRSRKRDRT